MRVVIVAGEASGDILGAGLVRALKEARPDIQFSGIGGPRMIAAGFESLFPMDRLSVMGIVEPLKRLPELLHIRKTVRQWAVDQKADLFIGIDSPDFNLPIEQFLHQRGMKTVHYVSPSVWAWRQGRIHKIRRSVNLMLTLLPFEADFYQRHQVPVCFVGHPLADEIPLQSDIEQARHELGVGYAQSVVALLPGSRASEVKLLGKLFLDTAEKLLPRIGPALFLVPAASPERKQQLESLWLNLPEPLKNQVRIIDGQSHQVMAAADAVLLASGTATLEAMLLKKPMVVAYRMSPLSHAIISRLIRTPYISLPNLLAAAPLVAEVLQDEATPERLARELEKVLTDSSCRNRQVEQFYRLHGQIRCDASRVAARAILELLA